MMEHPTVKDVESKIKVTLFTESDVNFQFRDVIYKWAVDEGVSVFWITSFLDSQQDEQGVHVYFDNEIDAMAFKLRWT